MYVYVYVYVYVYIYVWCVGVSGVDRLLRVNSDEGVANGRKAQALPSMERALSSLRPSISSFF